MTSSKLLQLAENERLAAVAGIDSARQSLLGQFFTPVGAAALVVSLPHLPHRGTLRVLDPGAGSGMLSAALVDRVVAERPELELHIVAVEKDESVLPHLSATLNQCEQAGRGQITSEVICGDFILLSTGLESDSRLQGFDLVIQNPPYGKLRTSSPHRDAMRGAGLDTPNLYAAFLALSADALREQGQLVAITPRSFFNGPYFGVFRRHLLERLALDRVHVFESRSTVFSDSGVLQENVIFSGTRGGVRGSVKLSTSRGDSDGVTVRVVPYAEVVHPGDEHRFVRLATHAEDTAAAEKMLALPCSLMDLGLEVSTGRVVDFRVRHAIHSVEPSGLSRPLVYSGNVRNGEFEWPRSFRKAQWFVPRDSRDEALLVPEGWYAVVKRFSAKEERRRVVAAVWSPENYPGSVAFENHLNYFHANGAGLDRELARGIALWLNSSLVDRYFRTFSGHTQVNATDLRSLRFPSPDRLREFGESSARTQSEIDALVRHKVPA